MIRKPYRKLALSAAAAGMMLGAGLQASAAGYTDVPKESSHHDNIVRANELGIMTGYGDGTFKPNGKLTRGNVVKALGKYVVKQSGLTPEEYVKTYGTASVPNFSDVPDSWADQELVMYSKIVKDMGIFKGSNNRLMAGNLITRDQMAEVLARTFAFRDLPGSPKIRDIGGSAYAKSIEILFENGISVANPYHPRATTSRAQLATFLVRSYDKVSKEESVMPASFYSELRQGKVPDAIVQIGSTLTELKKKAGEPEAAYDFEGGIRHVYGKYEYGVPHPVLEEGDPVTTVTYYFDEEPSLEEVMRHMGPVEQTEEDEDPMEYDYLWYHKGDFEVFFEYEWGGDTIDNVTVKSNR